MPETILLNSLTVSQLDKNRLTIPEFPTIQRLGSSSIRRGKAPARSDFRMFSVLEFIGCGCGYKQVFTFMIYKCTL